VRITRPTPGVFKGVDAAVEAQAAAQLKWDSGEAVWPVPPAIGCHARGQAPKRPPEDKRQWVHGAPNSKLSKGVGRGFNKGDNGKFVPKTIDQAKEERLETARLPADRNEITVECVRDFLVDPPTACAENTAPDWAQPPPVQPPTAPPPLGADA